MIREGRKEDISSAQAIAKECGFLSWSGYSLTGWVNWPGSIFLVAQEEGEVVGFLLGRVIMEEAEILVLGVKEDWRGRGFGYDLVDLLVRRLKIIEAKKAFLEVDTENHTAIELYKKHGFEKVGLRRKYYDGRRDAYIMELEL